MSSNWHPTATITTLKQRAAILAIIRSFFADRQVWEVETPLLYHSTASDPHIHSLTVQNAYLQTSPEFAMKRLLAAGSGSIYQISKAFRAEEAGRLHNQEFTLLEWYRVGFDHLQLMDEMDELFQLVLKAQPAERYTYVALFEQYLGLNPLSTTVQALSACAKQNAISFVSSLDMDTKDTWLHLLMTHCIEPHLGKERPVFVIDFPPSQAALAKIRPVDPPVAARFEVYFRGMELANGYHELTDATEQRRRFLADNEERKRLGLEIIPLDEHLLAALERGFPECSGVALGIDRLLMLALNKNDIREVVSFL